MKNDYKTLESLSNLWLQDEGCLPFVNIFHAVTKLWYCFYSGSPLSWTPWGPGKVPCVERWPHFRGIFIAFLGHSRVSLIHISGVSF